MAPEQIEGKPSAASDIWALGVIAYEMLTGRCPFNPASPFKTMETLRAGVRVNPVDLRLDLTEAAQDEILKALSFNTKDRHARAKDFGESLAQALTSDIKAEPDKKIELVREAEIKNETVNSALPQKMQSRLPVKPALVVIATLIIAAVITWIIIRQSGKTQPVTQAEAATSAERSLSYSVRVQKYRNGRPYEDPYPLAGADIVVEKDYRIKLKISSAQPGCLYILNEPPESSDEIALYTMLYASTTNKQTPSPIEIEYPEGEWLRFDEARGTEKFWLVWSARPVSELEAVKKLINPNDAGEIKDPRQVSTIREFLRKHSETSPEAEKDREKMRTNVKAKGDVLVYPLELEHR